MSRSLLNKTSELKDVNPVAGSSVSATDYISTLSLQVGGAGAQTQTLTYSSMANGDVVTVTIGPDAGDTKTLTITLDATTGASDTAAASAIADEINAATKISNLVAAVSVLGVVTLTGRQKGASATFYATSTVTGSGAVTVGTATSPTDATAIVPGCMCELSTATRVQGTADIGSAIGTATFAAKVITVDTSAGGAFTMGTNDRISFTVSVDVAGSGVQDFSAETTFSSDVATTLTAIAADLNLKVSPLIAVTVSSNNLVFTSSIAGYDFNVVGTRFDSSGPSYAAYAVTETTPAMPSGTSGAGVALFSQTVEQNASGVLEFGSGSELSALQVGKVHVLLDSGVTVAAGDPVWVRVTATGSEQVGAFRNAADLSDCLPLSSFGFSGQFAGANFTDMNGENVAPLSIDRL